MSRGQQKRAHHTLALAQCKNISKLNEKSLKICRLLAKYSRYIRP